MHFDLIVKDFIAQIVFIRCTATQFKFLNFIQLLKLLLISSCNSIDRARINEIFSGTA